MRHTPCQFEPQVEKLNDSTFKNTASQASFLFRKKSSYSTILSQRLVGPYELKGLSGLHTLSQRLKSAYMNRKHPHVCAFYLFTTEDNY